MFKIPTLAQFLNNRGNELELRRNKKMTLGAEKSQDRVHDFDEISDEIEEANVGRAEAVSGQDKKVVVLDTGYAGYDEASDAEEQTSTEEFERNNARIPLVLAVQFGAFGLVGLAIILIALILSIANLNLKIMKLSVLGVLAVATSLYHFSKWRNGKIVRHDVQCIAVTQYSDFSKTFTVTFRDVASNEQYVVKVRGTDCPYARDARYVIYTNKMFDGKVIAYEDSEFLSNNG